LMVAYEQALHRDRTIQHSCVFGFQPPLQ